MSFYKAVINGEEFHTKVEMDEKMHAMGLEKFQEYVSKHEVHIIPTSKEAVNNLKIIALVISVIISLFINIFLYKVFSSYSEDVVHPIAGLLVGVVIGIFTDRLFKRVDNKSFYIQSIQFSLSDELVFLMELRQGFYKSYISFLLNLVFYSIMSSI